METIKYTVKVILLAATIASPFPALPLFLINYAELGANATLIVGPAALIGLGIQYSIGRIGFKLIPKSKRAKAIGISNRVKEVNILELTVLSLSCLIPSKILTLACGFARYPFTNLVIASIPTFVANQIVYYYAAKNTNTIETWLIRHGVDNTVSRIWGLASGITLAAIALVAIQRFGGTKWLRRRNKKFMSILREKVEKDEEIARKY